MFRRNMLLQYSGFKREPQKKYVSRLTENEAGTNAVSGPRGEDHTKKHLEDENLQHRREKPQIPRDEQCLQGRNIYCKSSFTYIYKLLRHRYGRDISTRARNTAQRLASKTDTVNPLKAELSPIGHLLVLLGVHHFLHVSRIRVKSLTFRLLMLYIYIYI